jgi:hypothetical protein
MAPFSGDILHPLPFHPFTIAIGLLELLFGLPLVEYRFYNALDLF